MQKKNLKFLYTVSGFVLEIKLMDELGKTLFKERCNYKNKRALSRIFGLLEGKYSIPISKALKEQIGWWNEY